MPAPPPKPPLDDREALRTCLQVWSSFWRDVVLSASGAAAPLTNLDLAAQIEKLAAGLGLEKARAGAGAHRANPVR